MESSASESRGSMESSASESRGSMESSASESTASVESSASESTGSVESSASESTGSMESSASETSTSESTSESSGSCAYIIAEQQVQIVSAHNRIRSRVSPRASNMHRMVRPPTAIYCMSSWHCSYNLYLLLPRAVLE